MFKRIGHGRLFPWICGGDFNKILFVSKKNEKLDRNINQIHKLREVVMDAGMKDLSFQEENSLGTMGLTRMQRLGPGQTDVLEMWLRHKNI